MKDMIIQLTAKQIAQVSAIERSSSRPIFSGGRYSKNNAIVIAGKGMNVKPATHKTAVKAVAIPTANRKIISRFIVIPSQAKSPMDVEVSSH